MSSFRIPVPETDSDIVIVFPNGKELLIQLRPSNADINYSGSLDIILPENTVVTCFKDGLEVAPQVLGSPCTRFAKQLVCELPFDKGMSSHDEMSTATMNFFESEVNIANRYSQNATLNDACEALDDLPSHLVEFMCNCRNVREDDDSVLDFVKHVENMRDKHGGDILLQELLDAHYKGTNK